MSKADLELLRPLLVVMPAREVGPAGAPIERMLGEAAELARRLDSLGLRDRLRQIGLAATAFERLQAAVGALRAAQLDWEQARDRDKPVLVRELEAEGRRLARALLASCRWNLRTSALMGRALEAAGRDDTTTGLVDELETLASIVGQRPAAFEGDRSFDALDAALEARSIASRIRAELGLQPLDDEQRAALDLRDRAASYLADMLGVLREALRYATHDLESEASIPMLLDGLAGESGWFVPVRRNVARA